MLSESVVTTEKTVDIHSLKFKIADALLIVLTVLPIVLGIVLKVLTTPVSEGIEISGARIFFTIPMPLQDLPITESQVNSVIVLFTVFFLCLYLTHGLTRDAVTKRQHLAEWIVEKTEGLVSENMGPYFKEYGPLIGTILAISAFSSLLTLVGLYPPTSDVNIVAGWAILVFILITYYKLKGGILNYIKGFFDPIPVMAPMNIISEVSTPISMSFRHYGNVLSGSVISALVASGLAGLSAKIFGWLPGFLGEIPFLQIGIPAILSAYFDVFSGCIQAFIFAMLTMLYISNAFPVEKWLERKEKKKNKKTKKQTV